MISHASQEIKKQNTGLSETYVYGVEEQLPFESYFLQTLGLAEQIALQTQRHCDPSL